MLKNKTSQSVFAFIKKLSVFLLLIFILPFACCTQEVYELKKTDEGYRLTIKGYKDKFEPCYCPGWIHFSSLDDMRMSFINKSFTLKELYLIERDFLEDNNGDKIIVDLDNLYQPTMNDKPLTVTGIYHTPARLEFSVDLGDELGYDGLYGSVRYAINVKGESAIRNLIADTMNSLLGDELQAEKTCIEVADKKYELYQYVVLEYTEYSLINYELFVYDQEAVFVFHFQFKYTAEMEDLPNMEFFKLFSYKKC